MRKFETGKTYSMKSICDRNAIWECKVVKRTAKRLTLDITGEGIKTVGIKPDVNGDAERAYPLGKYSMAPSILA